MTPTIDVSTPAAVTSSLATTSTAAFQPPAGAWIVVTVQSDANNASTDETVTVSTTQLGVTFFRAEAVPNGTVAACAEIWAAYVGVSASMTIDVTDSKGAVPKHMVPRVYRDCGGIGAVAFATSTASVSYVSTVEGSLGIGCGLGSNLAPTAGTGCTLTDSTTGFDSGDAVWTVTRSAATALAGTTVTLNVTGLTGIRTVAVELLPTVAGPVQPILPGWLIQWLIMAVQSKASAPQSAITINGTANLAAASTVTTVATQGATAAPAGASALTAKAVAVPATTGITAATALTVASPVQTASAAIAGASLLVQAVATTSATASLAGAGALTAVVTQQAVAAVAAAGALTAAATITATAATTAASSLTANVTQVVIASATAASTLTANGASSGAATVAPAAATTLTATAVQAAGATAAGAATVVTNATQQAAAASTAGAALTVSARQQAVATVAAVSSLTATGTVGGVVQATASLVAASVVVATSVPQPATVVYHLDSSAGSYAEVEPGRGTGSAGGDGVTAAVTWVDSVGAGHVFE